MTHRLDVVNAHRTSQRSRIRGKDSLVIDIIRLKKYTETFRKTPFVR